MHNRTPGGFCTPNDRLIITTARNDYNFLMSGDKTILLETIRARLEETKEQGGHQLILYELYQLDMPVLCIKNAPTHAL